MLIICLLWHYTFVKPTCWVQKYVSLNLIQIQLSSSNLLFDAYICIFSNCEIYKKYIIPFKRDKIWNRDSRESRLSNIKNILKKKQSMNFFKKLISRTNELLHFTVQFYCHRPLINGIGFQYLLWKKSLIDKKLIFSL